MCVYVSLHHTILGMGNSPCSAAAGKKGGGESLLLLLPTTPFTATLKTTGPDCLVLPHYSLNCTVGLRKRALSPPATWGSAHNRTQQAGSSLTRDAQVLLRSPAFPRLKAGRPAGRPAGRRTREGGREPGTSRRRRPPDPTPSPRRPGRERQSSATSLIPVAEALQGDVHGDFHFFVDADVLQPFGPARGGGSRSGGRTPARRQATARRPRGHAARPGHSLGLPGATRRAAPGQGCSGRTGPGQSQARRLLQKKSETSSRSVDQSPPLRAK